MIVYNRDQWNTNFGSRAGHGSSTKLKNRVIQARGNWWHLQLLGRSRQLHLQLIWPTKRTKMEVWLQYTEKPLVHHQSAFMDHINVIQKYSILMKAYIFIKT
jgi:hypothetical protein